MGKGNLTTIDRLLGGILVRDLSGYCDVSIRNHILLMTISVTVFLLLPLFGFLTGNMNISQSPMDV